MNANDVKRCPKCARYLPLAQFRPDRRTRDGLTYRCDDCRLEHGPYGTKAGD